MLSYIPPAPSEPTSRVTSGSVVSGQDAGRFASALDAAEQVATHNVEQGEGDTDDDAAGGGDRQTSLAATERFAAAASQRGQLLGGAPVWQARDTSVLTGDDAYAPVDTRSWEYEGYLQVRGTFGRAVRDVVGDDSWLWELADQSGMGYPGPAVAGVLGQLADEWADRVGYEDPGGNGTSATVQYLRNPSGLAADHARFAGSEQLPDLAALGADRRPGDTTPAPDPTAPPAEPANEGSADATPQPADASSSPSEPGAGQNGDVEVAAAPAASGITAHEPDATIGATGLGVQVGAGVDPAGLQLSDLWREDEREG